MTSKDIEARIASYEAEITENGADYEDARDLHVKVKTLQSILPHFRALEEKCRERGNMLKACDTAARLSHQSHVWAMQSVDQFNEDDGGLFGFYQSAKLHAILTEIEAEQ